MYLASIKISDYVEKNREKYEDPYNFTETDKQMFEYEKETAYINNQLSLAGNFSLLTNIEMLLNLITLILLIFCM